MKWTLAITNNAYDKVYDFDANDEISAQTKALYYFDRFTQDTCQEYDHEDCLPTLTLYESPKTIPVDVVEYWKEKQVKNKKAYEQYLEEQEREELVRLQKKFAQ